MKPRTIREWLQSAYCVSYSELKTNVPSIIETEVITLKAFVNMLKKTF